MGAAGIVILFVLSLVGATITGIYFAAFASHYYLVVVEETSAGIDQVKPPDEPYLDWLWKLLFFMWLIGFWVAPAAVLTAVLAPALVSGLAGFLLLLLGLLWLVVPLSLLSCLSGRTMFTIVHLGFLRRVVRHPGSLLLFYLMSGVLLTGLGVLVYYAFFSLNGTAVLLVPPAAATVLLIHARLLGRIGWLVGYRTPDTKRKKPKPVKTKVEDPWAVPEEELPELKDLEVVGEDPPARERMSAPVTAIQAVKEKKSVSDVPASQPKKRADVPDTGIREGLDPFTADYAAPPASPKTVAPAPPALTAPITASLPPVEEEDEWTPNKKPYGLMDDAKARSTWVKPAEEKPLPEPTSPDEAEDEWTPNKKPYRVMDEAQAKSTWAPPPDESRLLAEEAYPLTAPEGLTKPPVPLDGYAPVGSDAPPPDVIAESALEEASPIKLSRFQMWLMNRRQPDPPPAYPMISGVFHFPWYPAMLGPWIYLTLLAFPFCLLLRMLVATWFLD
jgi:hypothetical protein